MISFYVLDGRHQNFNIISEVLGVLLNIITTITHADRMAEINAGLTDKLKKKRELARKNYNKYHLNVKFKAGDPVILRYINIKIKRTNKKLNYKKLGPYYI